MPGGDDTPKIQVDTDWKAEAQAEKERLTAQEKTQTERPQGPKKGGGLPEPSFTELVRSLAAQAIMGLGGLRDRETNAAIIDPDGSRFAIDLLAMLETKTKGNLTADESDELRQIIAELRAQYVHVMKLLSTQGATAAAPGSPAGGPAGSPPPRHGPRRT